MKPKTEPRKGWEESFREMHENGDDKSLMPDIFDEESFEEWEEGNITYLKTYK